MCISNNENAATGGKKKNPFKWGLYDANIM